MTKYWVEDAYGILLTHCENEPWSKDVNVIAKIKTIEEGVPPPLQYWVIKSFDFAEILDVVLYKSYEEAEKHFEDSQHEIQMEIENPRHCSGVSIGKFRYFGNRSRKIELKGVVMWESSLDGIYWIVAILRMGSLQIIWYITEEEARIKYEEMNDKGLLLKKVEVIHQGDDESHFKGALN